MIRSDALNDALDRLDGLGYEMVPGFASHGPMGAETLSTLGHDDLVGRWVETYKARHRHFEKPPTAATINLADRESWLPALGDFARVSDWEEAFARELEERRWREVVDVWVSHLFDGCAGGLTHGLIRVAHAVRGMPSEGVPSQLMLNELARGLAYWAARFNVLPGKPRLLGRLPLADAFLNLPRVPPGERGTLKEAGAFMHISDLTEFPRAVEDLCPPTSLDDALSELTAMSCRVMLSHPEIFPVPLVHMVTATLAVRVLKPFASSLTEDVTYATLWRVNAGIVAAFAQPKEGASEIAPQLDEDAPTASELVSLAVEHQDTHVMKFTDACVTEFTLNPDPVYLVVAKRVMDRLPNWSRTQSLERPA